MNTSLCSEIGSMWNTTELVNPDQAAGGWTLWPVEQHSGALCHVQINMWYRMRWLELNRSHTVKRVGDTVHFLVVLQIWQEGGLKSSLQCGRGGNDCEGRLWTRTTKGLWCHKIIICIVVQGEELSQRLFWSWGILCHGGFLCPHSCICQWRKITIVLGRSDFVGIQIGIWRGEGRWKWWFCHRRLIPAL